jgi:hypothetical protein
MQGAHRIVGLRIVGVGEAVGERKVLRLGGSFSGPLTSRFSPETRYACRVPALLFYGELPIVSLGGGNYLYVHPPNTCHRIVGAHNL